LPGVVTGAHMRRGDTVKAMLERAGASLHGAKLEVSFFRPFWGGYWILDLGADYEYAVVGHPGRDYLWILRLKAELYEAIVQRLAAQGYETNRLVRTVQGPAPEKWSAEAR
jgi:lipocalin